MIVLVLLPATSNACGTADGLSKSIVIFPAFAVSFVLSNFSAPVGSAAMVSVDPPPEDATAAVAARAVRPHGRTSLS